MLFVIHFYIFNADSNSSSEDADLIPILGEHLEVVGVFDARQDVNQDAGPNFTAAGFVINMLGHYKCIQVQLKSVKMGANNLVQDVVNQTLDSVNNILTNSG